MSDDVEVSGGVVRGSRDEDLITFRGIPYAALSERFGAPQPVRPWNGVREATRFGPPPPQSGVFGMDALTEEGDDWLTVNVWSSDLGGRLPVMVWIQGGAYAFGMSGVPEYDGSNLTRNGVVVVTFNYRVGLEGFGLIEGAPANRGLLDQVAVLQWVQGNISGFGGDPDRVTVFGQSAGGGSVAALLAMPKATGLFRRAIAQSVAGTYFTPDLAADITRACAAEFGLQPAQLSTVDPYRLPGAGDTIIAKMGQFTDRWGLAAHARIPFAPVIDGEVLPTTPWQGVTGQVELMAGHTRDEQRLLTALSGLLGTITDAQAQEAARLFSPAPFQYRSLYPVAEELYEVVRSDWLFRMPSLKLVEAQLAAGGVAYLYELTWSAPGMGGVLGACHGLDVPLVFGNLTVGGPAALIGDTSAEAVTLSEQMRNAWTAFATTGSPGWSSHADGSTRLFDAEPAVCDYPEFESRNIWVDYPEVLDLT